MFTWLSGVKFLVYVALIKVTILKSIEMETF